MWKKQTQIYIQSPFLCFFFIFTHNLSWWPKFITQKKLADSYSKKSNSPNIPSRYWRSRISAVLSATAPRASVPNRPTRSGRKQPSQATWAGDTVACYTSALLAPDLRTWPCRGRNCIRRSRCVDRLRTSYTCEE